VAGRSGAGPEAPVPVGSLLADGTLDARLQMALAQRRRLATLQQALPHHTETWSIPLRFNSKAAKWWDFSLITDGKNQ